MLSMPRALFRAHLSKSPEITFAVSAYSAKVLTLMTQSVACNALHTIGQRCARWLLVTGDRVDSATFVMTHKLVARMLGAHRPGISLALGRLQRLGLIEAGLGRIRILDRPGLEAESCECYRLVVRDVNGVFGARASRARG
jgi:CRP-like cAMP-binding protein